MDFSFLAADKQGVKQKGKLEANDQKEVIDYLRSKGLTPLSVKNLEKKNSSILNYFSRVKGGDIVLFTRQLASMILTGLTVIESLNILKHQNNKPQMQKILDDLIANLSEGNSLSKALSNYPAVFSTTYIALIESAEEGGILDKVLERLADNLEKSDEVHKRVKSALFYPGIIVTGVIVVIIMMNVFVIPQMGALYDSLDLKLPIMTRIVLAGSKLTTTLLPFSVFFIIGGVIGYRRFSKTAMGIRLIDKVKLRAPVFGDITRLSILSEISRTVSLLVNSGGSLINALNIAGEVSGNLYYKNALVGTSSLVEKGAGLSIALQNQNIFPPLMIQMVKVGESTGKIDESLLKVSEYFERDLDIKVKTLTTSIEPILIIFLGVTVAFLIISVITPIYSLVSQIQ
jgi:type IV pilus assembly protein PilC